MPNVHASDVQFAASPKPSTSDNNSAQAQPLNI
jgi:hypothetical protein